MTKAPIKTMEHRTHPRPGVPRSELPAPKAGYLSYLLFFKIPIIFLVIDLY